MDVLYSKPSKWNNDTKKKQILEIDDSWSLDLLDLGDYGPENNRRYE